MAAYICMQHVPKGDPKMQQLTRNIVRKQAGRYDVTRKHTYISVAMAK